MTTYSTLLYKGFVPTSFTEVFTVPANELSVVRDMEFYNGGADNPTFNVQVGVPGSTAVAFSSNDLGASKHTQWQGRIVIPAGAGLWLFSSAPNVQAVISGYLFTS